VFFSASLIFRFCWALASLRHQPAKFTIGRRAREFHGAHPPAQASAAAATAHRSCVGPTLAPSAVAIVIGRSAAGALGLFCPAPAPFAPCSFAPPPTSAGLLRSGQKWLREGQKIPPRWRGFARQVGNPCFGRYPPSVFRVGRSLRPLTPRAPRPRCFRVRPAYCLGHSLWLVVSLSADGCGRFAPVRICGRFAPVRICGRFAPVRICGRFAPVRTEIRPLRARTDVRPLRARTDGNTAASRPYGRKYGRFAPVRMCGRFAPVRTEIRPLRARTDMENGRFAPVFYDDNQLTVNEMKRNINKMLI